MGSGLVYSKGDHDGAISQYIRTIGHLEPSYVIRKVSLISRISLSWGLSWGLAWCIVREIMMGLYHSIYVLSVI